MKTPISVSRTSVGLILETVPDMDRPSNINGQMGSLRFGGFFPRQDLSKGPVGSNRIKSGLPFLSPVSLQQPCHFFAHIGALEGERGAVYKYIGPSA